MGHYDDCYEETAKDDRKRELKEMREEFNEEIKSLKDKDKIFLLKIIKDINKWKSFYNLIKNTDL